MSGSGSSAYFRSTKPSFLSQVRERTFDGNKNESPPTRRSTTKANSPSPHSSKNSNTSQSGLGDLMPRSKTNNTSRTSSSGLGGMTPTSDGGSPSSGLGKLTPVPMSGGSTGVSPLSGLTPMSTSSTATTSSAITLNNLPPLDVSSSSETMPTPPVPKPRTKKLSMPSKAADTPIQPPKPRPRSFHEEESFAVVSSADINAPIPAPRKKFVSPVKPDSPEGQPLIRERIFSKGTKEYKAQKKDSPRLIPKPKPEIDVIPQPMQNPLQNQASKGLAMLPPFFVDEDPRSIINIIDLDIQSSMRSQYLTKEDIEVNNECDSDEETNQQVEPSFNNYYYYYTDWNVIIITPTICFAILPLIVFRVNY